MTNPSARKPAPRHSHEPTSRHSHESGNLEMKSNRHLSEITETEQTRFPPYMMRLYDALYQRGALLFLTFPFDSQVKGAFLCQ
ncbi:hypothetical protein COH80_02645 [Neisseria meningitidis]|nr:hypothetical protein COH80_02645 [Neisseria meningitidis]